MKRKKLKKIPFMTVPRIVETDKNTNPGFIATAACVDVENEPHIILEVYRNTPETLKIPTVRYVATHKDFGIYYPKNKKWSARGITSNLWEENYDAPRWYIEEGIWYEKYHMESDTMLCSAADLKVIKDYFSDCNCGHWIYDTEYWLNYFKNNERDIRIIRAETREKRLKAAISERTDKTPPLPIEKITAWAEKEFCGEHYLYYVKKNRTAQIKCSACGGERHGRYVHADTYEGRFAPHIEEPINKKEGRCPMCGADGIYISMGRHSREIRKTYYAFAADKYGEKGAVIRYIKIIKTWGPINSGFREKVITVELARKYFEPDKKPVMLYENGNEWSTTPENISGYQIKRTVCCPNFMAELEGTILQYSAIDLYEAAAGGVDAFNYMEMYIRHPQIETLVKLGLFEIIKSINYYHNTGQTDELLSICRGHMQLLRQTGGDPDIIRVLKLEKLVGGHWTDKQITEMSIMDITSEEKFRKIQSVMTLQKFLNAVHKYAGVEDGGEGCTMARRQLRQTSYTYVDYLDMRRELGYDLNNTVYQRPRNLLNAHEEMVTETDKKRFDEKTKAAENKYPDIRKKYRSLCRRYCYSDDTYVIRPAKSAGEIMLEGRRLHHCVGGDTYLSRHNAGDSIILMLRFKTDRDTPYITVEIKGSTVLQWYGDGDKKPDKEHMQDWIDRYAEWLEEKERIRMYA